MVQESAGVLGGVVVATLVVNQRFLFVISFDSLQVGVIVHVDLSDLQTRALRLLLRRKMLQALAAGEQDGRLTSRAFTIPQRMPKSEQPMTKPKENVSSIIALEFIY